MDKKAKKEKVEKKIAKIKDADKFGRHSIKFKLVAIFSIMIILASSTVGLVSIQRAKASLISQGDETLVSLANEGARLTKKSLESDTEALATVSVLDKVRGMNLEEQKYVLKMQVDRTDFQDIGVVALDGETNYTDSSKANLFDRQYIRRIFEGVDGTFDFVVSKVTGKPVLMLATPIKENGEIKGALVGRKDGMSLQGIVEGSGFGKTGYSYIINRKGDIIGHNDENLVLSQFNPITSTEKSEESMKESFERIVAGSSGVDEYNFNGKDIKVGYSSISGIDWVFVSAVETEAFLAPINDMIWRNLRTVLFAILIAVPATIYVGISITKPIVETSRIARKISSLDLSEDISEDLLKRQDELGDLGRSFETLILNVRDIINAIHDSSDRVAAASEELTATSQELATGSLEVTKTVNEVAKGAEEQAINTEGGSLKADDLGNTLNSNNGYLEGINNSAEHVLQTVNVGLEEIEDLSNITIRSMEAMQEIQRVILEANESAADIGKASSVIADIAEQTNLLALNAAIEAARAGEAGRGFTVVAEEIRRLAEKSSESTHEIDVMVEKLQANSSNSVSVMGETMEIVKAQGDGVNKNKESYNIISGSIAETYELIEELNTANKEMNSMKDEIVDFLQNLTAIAEENSAATVQASAVIEEQSASAEEIAHSSEGLAHLAEDLKELISKFKI